MPRKYAYFSEFEDASFQVNFSIQLLHVKGDQKTPMATDAELATFLSDVEEYLGHSVALLDESNIYNVECALTPHIEYADMFPLSLKISKMGDKFDGDKIVLYPDRFTANITNEYRSETVDYKKWQEYWGIKPLDKIGSVTKVAVDAKNLKVGDSVEGRYFNKELGMDFSGLVKEFTPDPAHFYLYVVGQSEGTYEFEGKAQFTYTATRLVVKFASGGTLNIKMS